MQQRKATTGKSSRLIIAGTTSSKVVPTEKTLTTYQQKNNKNNKTKYSIFAKTVLFCYVLLTAASILSGNTNLRRIISFDHLLLESNNNNNEDNDIRNWGCHRTETPFIFVHIGKAGGGSVRARIAASAEHYKRPINDWFHDDGKDGHYYPILLSHLSNNDNHHDNTHHDNAYFCESRYPYYAIPNSTIKPITMRYQIAGKKKKIKSVPCNATTPIGLAIACPGPTAKKERCNGCNNVESEYCRSVYVAHHKIGSELHWLPSKYLQNWWQNTSSSWDSSHSHSHSHTSNSTSSLSPSLSSKNMIDQYFSTLTPGEESWCPMHQLSRPEKNEQLVLQQRNDSDNDYYRCELSLASTVDTTFRDYWKQQQQKQLQHHQQHEEQEEEEHQPSLVSSITTTGTGLTTAGLNFGPLYASLPLHRVVLLREPYSWLISKFLWHDIKARNSGLACDAKVKETIAWVTEFGITSYILALCGSDCLNRYEHGIMTLEEMEQQAAYNLKHSFSVVGLLEERDIFYDMITKRIQYMNTSYNLDVVGLRHATNQNRESRRCHKRFQSWSFQRWLRKRIPVINSLERLYQLGVKVNQYQQKELQQCILRSY